MCAARNKKAPAIAYALLWIGYLALLTDIVLFKGSWEETRAFVEILRGEMALERRKVYLRPFESTKLFLGLWEYSYARWNVIGNLLLFFPFGMLTGGVGKGWKGFCKTLLLAGLASFFFESIQFLYAIGEFDVDDILLNVLGALLGYGAVRLWAFFFGTARGGRR